MRKIEEFVKLLNTVLQSFAPLFPDIKLSYDDACDSPAIKVTGHDGLAEELEIVGLLIDRNGLSGPAVQVWAQSYWSYMTMRFSQFLVNPRKIMEFPFDGDHTMSKDKLKPLIDYIIAIAYMPDTETSFVDWLKKTKEKVKAFIEGTGNEQAHLKNIEEYENGYWCRNKPSLEEVCSTYSEFIAQPLPFVPYDIKCKCHLCKTECVCVTTLNSRTPFCLTCYPIAYDSYLRSAEEFLKD